MKISFCLASLFVMIAMVSCEPDLSEEFRIYKIKQGEHYCEQRRVEMLQEKVLSFRARFDESAIYHFAESGFQDSKNKLLGFSDCNAAHHENSARFAWQWYNERLEIYAYCYVNGNRVEAFLGTVEINETAEYRIELTDENYIFSFKGSDTAIKRGSVAKLGAYLILWPYFGGQIAAPHDISIMIDRF